jgi:hypothetical protein
MWRTKRKTRLGKPKRKSQCHAKPPGRTQRRLDTSIKPSKPEQQSQSKRPSSRRCRLRVEQRQSKKATAPFEADVKDIERRRRQTEYSVLQSVEQRIMDTFGIVADVTKSRRHNAATYLSTMHPWAYFSRPSNMAFHDLSTVLKPPKNLRSLMGLSLKFIPSPRKNVPWTTYQDHTFARFDRELKVKFFMADHEDDGTYNPDLYVKSRWTPPPWKIPLEITRRLHSFK